MNIDDKVYRSRMGRKLSLIITVLLCYQPSTVVGFVATLHSRSRVSHHSSSCLYASSFEEQVRNMSVRNLKKELDALQVSTVDVFEKEELVARFLQATKAKSNGSSGAAADTVASPSKAADNSDCMTAPLYLTSLGEGSQIAAVNMNGGITIPSGTLYPSLKLAINGKTVALLLDTACTGIIIKPHVVKDCNLRVFQTPVTITAAGGDMGRQESSVAQLDQFQIGEHVFRDQTYPAAVQDMEVLAGSLDGIIGLSFLKQFAAVDLDFAQGQIKLYRKQPPAVDAAASQTILATCQMKSLPQVGGIYYVPVYFGGRGPVNMLVDSGASATILSWKGLADLGLDATSPSVQRVHSATGSLGLDKVVTDLTHRIYVSSRMTLQGDESPGVSLAGAGRLPIDIGPIPLLEALASQGVGGILGIDALMRSSICRLSFQGEPRVTFIP